MFHVSTTTTTVHQVVYKKQKNQKGLTSFFKAVIGRDSCCTPATYQRITTKMSLCPKSRGTLFILTKIHTTVLSTSTQ